MMLNLLIAVDHQPEGRGLNATDGKQPLKALGRKAGLVHTEAHVGHLTGICRITARTALLIRYEMVERFDDVFLDVVIDVDPLDLASVPEVIKDLIDDELTFIIRVTGVDDRIRFFQQFPDALDQLALVAHRLFLPVWNLDGQHVE